MRKKQGQRDRDHKFSALKSAEILLEGKGSEVAEQLHAFCNQLSRLLLLTSEETALGLYPGAYAAFGYTIIHFTINQTSPNLKQV